jgi:UDP-2,3-diacylglucosamine pyrophosphatase LpxH
MHEHGPNGEDPARYRAVFLSDVHLGHPDCQAEALLAFLRTVRCDTLYLVGDIVDFWSLKRAWYWHPLHNDVVQKLLRLARKGTRIVYVAGNHDEAVRDFAPMRFGNVRVAKRAVHVTADGRRLLVLHGDEFDGLLRYEFLVTMMGGIVWRLLLAANGLLNAVRRRLGWSYGSLAGLISNNTDRWLDRFRNLVVAEAEQLGFDGVVCGHVHRAEQRVIGDVLYLNDGDWVESCTAVVEHPDGRLELIHPSRAASHTASSAR